MQKTLMMFLDDLLYFPENVPTLGIMPKHLFPAAWSSSVNHHLILKDLYNKKYYYYYNQI
jgi:hypothetical protein